MMPLGLKPGPDLDRYTAWLFRTHDFAISVDVLDLDHTPRRSLTESFIDGQVNLQRNAAVTRSATFTFYDPDHSLALDADSPWEGAVYADRMIRVRHTVTVPGLGTVVAVPFVGPIVKVSRDGDTLQVECQDKAVLALTGTAPVTGKKGHDAVDAIRRIMSTAAGENKFRLPSGFNRNLHKSYSTGWHEDASPWVVCQRIAAQLNRQLLYSCDGYLTLRPWPSGTTITATGSVVTSPPQVDFDSSAVANMVRVTGTLAPPKQKARRADAKPQLERPATKLSAVAVAAPGHPLSPARLGRNGVPRYLPIIIEGAVYKSLAQARQLAAETLSHDLLMTTGVSFDMVPVFHLDVGDLILAQTDAGRVLVRLQEASIPLGVSGDMSVGTQRNVSRSRKRSRVSAHSRRPPPTKQARKQYAHDLAAWRKSQKGQHHHG
jgi:hypothetical protein